MLIDQLFQRGQGGGGSRHSFAVCSVCCHLEFVLIMCIDRLIHRNVQPHFQGAASRTRLLLFRECEVRGRRLLFDSAAGQAKDDTGLQQDIQLMKDMVFGSATLKYFGDNYRVHDFGTVPWRGYHMMLTKVFLVPPPTSSSKVGPRYVIT